MRRQVALAEPLTRRIDRSEVCLAVLLKYYTNKHSDTVVRYSSGTIKLRKHNQARLWWRTVQDI